MASFSTHTDLEQRTYVKFRTILEIPSKDIHEELVTVCGHEALSYSTVRRWVNCFRKGRTSVEDAPRPGAPKLAINEEKIAKVETFIEWSPYSSVEEVATYADISTGSAHTILTTELLLRKVNVRWVPHSLTMKQKDQRVQMAKQNLEIYDKADSRRLLEIVTGDETWISLSIPIRKQEGKVWLGKGEIPPSVTVSDFRAEKVLYCIFFDGLGPVAQIPVPKGQTLTGHFTHQ